VLLLLNWDFCWNVCVLSSEFNLLTEIHILAECVFVSLCNVAVIFNAYRQQCALHAFKWRVIRLHRFESGCVGHATWSVPHEAKLFSESGPSTIVSSKHCLIYWTWTNLYPWEMAKQWYSYSEFSPISSYVEQCPPSESGELMDMSFTLYFKDTFVSFIM
jgi:hypothetical protein